MTTGRRREYGGPLDRQMGVERAVSMLVVVLALACSQGAPPRTSMTSGAPGGPEGELETAEAGAVDSGAVVDAPVTPARSDLWRRARLRLAARPERSGARRRGDSSGTLERAGQRAARDAGSANDDAGMERPPQPRRRVETRPLSPARTCCARLIQRQGGIPPDDGYGAAAAVCSSLVARGKALREIAPVIHRLMKGKQPAACYWPPGRAPRSVAADGG